jgi:formiminotetrahydrofolate cyclodeaminase
MRRRAATRARLVEERLGEVLAAFAAPTPTPAGGSASALASAVGTSLLTMVAGLPKTRSGSDGERSILSAATIALTGVLRGLTEAIDGDAAAFEQVVAARGFPKASREAQHAFRAATDVPLQVMRLSSIALQQAQAVAERGHRPALSDVAVAIALVGAGFQGARSTVRSNLAAVDDRELVDAITAEVERLSAETAQAATLASRVVEQRGGETLRFRSGRP